MTLQGDAAWRQDPQKLNSQPAWHTQQKTAKTVSLTRGKVRTNPGLLSDFHTWVYMHPPARNVCSLVAHICVPSTWEVETQKISGSRSSLATQ